MESNVYPDPNNYWRRKAEQLENFYAAREALIARKGK